MPGCSGDYMSKELAAQPAAAMRRSSIYDTDLYEHNEIERLYGRIKRFRRVFTAEEPGVSRLPHASSSNRPKTTTDALSIGARSGPSTGSRSSRTVSSTARMRTHTSGDPSLVVLSAPTPSRHRFVCAPRSHRRSVPKVM